MNVTKFSRRTLNKIWKRGISQGFNPFICPKVNVFYDEDAPRFGRLGITIEKQQEVLNKVNSDWYG